jgi:hypothetical protein
MDLVIDAVEATGQVGASDLLRLHETLYALQTLSYLQSTCKQVGCPCLPSSFSGPRPYAAAVVNVGMSHLTSAVSQLAQCCG